jgi:membrane-associated phospholipid phosphatase
MTDRSTSWMVRVRLRPDEWRVVAVAILVLAFATADVLTGGPLTALDRAVRAAIEPRPPTTPWWLAVPEALGDLGVGAPVLAIAALICAQALWRLWPVVMSIGIFVAAEGAVLILKTLVARPGPGEWADRTGYPGYFPSGHTTTAAVVTGTVVYLVLAWRRHGDPVPRAEHVSLVAGLAAGTLAAVGAVMGDFHWTSDGIAGLALSAAVLEVGFASTRGYLQRKECRRSGVTSLR